MIKKMALELIQQYISGWKQNNLQLITSCLTKNCVVIESHGPTYHGIGDIERWFEYWLQANSTVTKWDILSFSFCEKEQTAFCEWEFICLSNHIEYSLPGISVIKFKNNKIAFIHEYRMTRSAYQWNRDELKSV
jgi:hypothetical protein